MEKELKKRMSNKSVSEIRKIKFSTKDLNKIINNLVDSIIVCNPKDKKSIAKIVDKSERCYGVEIKATSCIREGELCIMKKE